MIYPQFYMITVLMTLALAGVVAVNYRKEFLYYSKTHYTVINKTFAAIFFTTWFTYLILKINDGAYFQLMMGDICPFLAVFCIPILSTTKNRDNKLLKAIAPWMIVIAFLFFIASSYAGEVYISSTETIISYIRHFLLLTYGLWFVLNSSLYTWGDVVRMVMFKLGFLLYVFVVVGSAKALSGNEWYAVYSTALFSESYQQTVITIWNGNQVTYGAYAMFGDIGWGYPWPTVLMYFVAMALSLISLKTFPLETYEKLKNQDVTSTVSNK